MWPERSSARTVVGAGLRLPTASAARPLHPPALPTTTPWEATMTLHRAEAPEELATGRASPLPGPEGAEGPAGRRRFAALAVIGLAQLMVVLDASVVIVALPSAQRSLHIATANRQWVMTAYSLAFGSLLLLGGRIADYLGRRRMFVLSLIGFAGASALGGLAQDQAMLFGARALQGAFAAVMAPAALSLLTVTYTEPTERARAFGVYGAIAGSGAAIGLVLGGTLTQFTSWRWTLLINVPIALVAAVGATRTIAESRSEVRGHYDVPGAAIVTAGLFLLVYGFTVAGSHGWGASETIGLLAAAVAVLVGFVVLERRSSHPLLPLRVVAQRDRGGAFAASTLVGSAMLGTFLFLTYFFQGTLHYSALRTGFAFLPFSGGIILGAGLSSRLVPRTGPRLPMAVGLTMAAVGLAWLTRLGVDSSYAVHVLPGEILVSLGMGMAFVPMSSTALIGVDDAEAGVASALVNTTQQVGGSLGTSLLNTVAASSAATYLVAHQHLVGAGGVAAVHGYTTAFIVSTVLLALAAVVAGVTIRSSGSTPGSGAVDPLAQGRPEPGRPVAAPALGE
ncbi:MAG TPA: MFS transporter [Acidimicrobiales bacterium]|jgi:EmrB/QacA subfamily drug resistance transporter